MTNGKLIGFIKARRGVIGVGLGLLLLLVIVVRVAGPKIDLTWAAGFQYRLVYLLTPCSGEIHQYEDESISFSWREPCGEENYYGGNSSGFRTRLLDDALWLSSSYDKLIEVGDIRICRYKNADKAFIKHGKDVSMPVRGYSAKRVSEDKSVGLHEDEGPDSGTLSSIISAVDSRVSGRIKIIKTRAGEIAIVDNKREDLVCFHDVSKRLYCFSATVNPRSGADYSVIGRLYFELTGEGLATSDGPFQVGVPSWLKIPSFDKRKVCRTETIIKTLRVKGK